MITTSQPKVARLSDHERDLRQTNIKLALPFITDSGTRARFLEMLADEAEDRWDDASNAVPA